MAFFIVFWDENRSRKRKFRIHKKMGKGNGNRNQEQTSIRSSEKYCPYCYRMIANEDPDREDIDNERRHKSCFRGLTVAQSKNTELREAVNL